MQLGAMLCRNADYAQTARPAKGWKAGPVFEITNPGACKPWFMTSVRCEVPAEPVDGVVESRVFGDCKA